MYQGHVEFYLGQKSKADWLLSGAMPSRVLETMALLALNATPPEALLLPFMYQWIDNFLKITMVCLLFSFDPLKGNCLPKARKLQFWRRTGSFHIGSLSWPEREPIRDPYIAKRFHY